jgi:hypothetical protein
MGTAPTKASDSYYDPKWRLQYPDGLPDTHPLMRQFGPCRGDMECIHCRAKMFGLAWIRRQRQ